MVISGIVFALGGGGALLAMSVRDALPAHHLSADAKEIMKLAMGLIATTAALVLGLLIASAKGSYDTQRDEIKEAAANVVLLDRILAHYGPESKEARDVLRAGVAAGLEATWPESGAPPVRLDAPERTPMIEIVEDKIRDLSPRDEKQQWHRSRALQIVGDLQRTRWLLFGGLVNSIPMPFLVVLVVWITVIFTILGLFAPRNATVVTVLLVCALSVSASIFLILEMDRPFEGLMKISSAPLRYALAHLGQ